MKLNLQEKYALVILSNIVLIVVLLTGVVLVQSKAALLEVSRTSSDIMKNSLYAEIEKRAEVLIRFVSGELVNPLYRYDLGKISSLTRSIKNQQDVSYVYVYDASGRIVTDGTPENSHLDQVLADEVSRRAVTSRTLLIQQVGDLVDVSIPIILRDTILGGIRIGYTLAGVKRQVLAEEHQIGSIGEATIRKNLMVISLIAAGLVVLGILLAVVAARRLTRPINYLSRLAVRVGQGEYDEDIRVTRSDEIGNMEYAFKRMIDNLKETTVSKNYLFNIINSMKDMLVVLDVDNKIRTVNREACEVLGYGQEELTGRDFGSISEWNGNSPGGIWQALSGGESVSNHEMTYRTRTGDRIPVLFSGSVITDVAGQPREFVGIARDITERRQSEERFRNLVEGSIQGIIIHRGGKPLFANQTFANIFGYDSPADVVAHASLDVLSAPSFRELMNRYYRQRIRGEAVPERYEFQGVRKDGTLIWLENYARVVNWEGMAAVQSTLYEITDRKRAEEELRRGQRLLQSIIDTLPQWITVKDVEGRYLLVNRTMADAHGSLVSDFVSRKVEESPVQIEAARVQSRKLDRLVMETGDRVEEPEWSYVPPNGAVPRVRRQIKFPLRDESGVITGIISWSEDITERKHAEKDLRLAKEGAEKATRLKDKFMSLIAHDLRAPIGSIRLMVDMLDPDKGSVSGAESQRALRQAISDKCGALLEMIDELLKISRLQSGTLQPVRRFVNAQQVTTAPFELKPLADKKGVHMENRVPDNVRLYVDPDLFREVIQNLIANAIKFSRSGGTVTVYCPSEDQPAIAVKDTGIGISEKLIDDLFKHEVKTTTPGTEGELGTGLGLPLCNDIMVAHGGRLNVESVKGKGTTIVAELPAVRPLALIVDPDAEQAGHLRNLLDTMDVNVETADSPSIAQHIIRLRHPDLIMVDVPRMAQKGYQFLERIKSDPAYRDIPVIVVSGQAGVFSREAVIRLGADDFLMKPVSDGDLSSHLRRFIG